MVGAEGSVQLKLLANRDFGVLLHNCKCLAVECSSTVCVSFQVLIVLMFVDSVVNSGVAVPLLLRWYKCQHDKLCAA